MKSHMEMLLTLLCLMVFGFETSRGARLLLENDRESLFVVDFHVRVGAQTTGVPCTEAEIRTGAGSEKESARNEKVVGNILPCRPGERPHPMIGEQRLSTSKPGPSVGHMQIFNIGNSQQGGEVGHLLQQQKEESKKRVLKSSPSPGAGH